MSVSDMQRDSRKGTVATEKADDERPEFGNLGKMNRQRWRAQGIDARERCR